MTFPETFISKAEVKGISPIRFSLEIIDPASFFPMRLSWVSMWLFMNAFDRFEKNTQRRSSSSV